jgi:hypothetical protein
MDRIFLKSQGYAKICPRFPEDVDVARILHGSNVSPSRVEVLLERNVLVGLSLGQKWGGGGSGLKVSTIFEHI